MYLSDILTYNHHQISHLHMKHLPAVIERWLADDQTRTTGARAAQDRAEVIVTSDFWHGIDSGLRVRGLPMTGVGVT